MRAEGAADEGHTTGSGAGSHDPRAPRAGAPLRAPPRRGHRRLARRGRRARRCSASRIGQQTSDNLVLPGTDSQQATDILDEALPRAGQRHEPDRAARAARARSSPTSSTRTRSTASSTPTRRTRRSRRSSARSRATAPGQLAKDGTIGYISLTLKDEPERADRRRGAEHHRRRRPGRRRAGMQVAAGGYLGPEGLQAELATLSEVVGHRRGDRHPAVHVRHAPWPWGCRSSPRSSAWSAA